MLRATLAAMAAMPSAAPLAATCLVPGQFGDTFGCRKLLLTLKIPWMGKKALHRPPAFTKRLLQVWKDRAAFVPSLLLLLPAQRKRHRALSELVTELYNPLPGTSVLGISRKGKIK